MKNKRYLMAVVILLAALPAGCKNKEPAQTVSVESTYAVENVSASVVENTSQTTDVETEVEVESEEKEADNETEAQTESENETESFTEEVETEVESSDEQSGPNVSDFVRVKDYIPDIIVDLRYATADNFTGQVLYDFDEAYLRYGTVLKLKAAHEELKQRGYLIKIWDAYRPFYAQEFMWSVCPDGRYVANPAKGRRNHNLGITVDITIVNLDGTEVVMPTGFDDFSTRADRDYSEVDAEAAENAMMLEEVMYANGFEGCSTEWWDYTDTSEYSDFDEDDVFISKN